MMIPTFNPRKNSLSVSLAESVVFLRSVDVSTRRPVTAANGPPSMLRGLLILNLVRPTRISSIRVDLVGESVTMWTEGTSSHLLPQYWYRFALLQDRARVIPQSCRRRLSYILPLAPSLRRPVFPPVVVPSPSNPASLIMPTKPSFSMVVLVPLHPRQHAIRIILTNSTLLNYVEAENVLALALAPTSISRSATLL